MNKPLPANRSLTELDGWPRNDMASCVDNVKSDLRRNEIGEAEIVRQLEYSSAEDANGRQEVGDDCHRAIDSKHRFPWVFIGGVLLVWALVVAWMIWK